MLRLLLTGASLITLCFALLLLALHVFPLGDTAHGAFGNDPASGDCAMPCWQGLSPGSTNDRVALAHLKAAGWALQSECNAPVYEVCYIFVGAEGQVANVYMGRGQVEQIALLQADLTLADIWLSLGAPDYITLPAIWMNDPAFQMALWFGSSGVSARLGFACPQHFGDLLASPVDSLLIWAPGTAMQGTLLGTVTDLRRSLWRACHS